MRYDMLILLSCKNEKCMCHTPEGMRHVHGPRVEGSTRAWQRAGLPRFCMLRIHMIHAHECMKKTACISAVYRPYTVPPEIAEIGEL